MTAMVPSLDRLGDYVRHWSRATPDAQAWAFGDRIATYAELEEQVNATARALLALGVRRGDRVAMLTPPRPEYWQVFLASATIGAVWVGLNPRYQIGEISHVLTDSEPVLLLAQTESGRDSFVEQVAARALELGVREVVTLAADGSDWTGFLARGSEVSTDAVAQAARRVRPEDPALIVYTSGTTGAPKGAVLGNAGLCMCFRIQAEHQSASRMRVIANLPVNHIGGVGDLCCTPLVRGGLLVFQERFDPEEMFAAIERHQISSLMQVPTTLKMLTEHPRFETADLSSLESVHWGGGPLPLHVIRRLRRVAPVLGVTYGMTEITGSVTYSDVDASDECLSESVGRPIAEVEMRLCGEGAQDVGVGIEGEVQVKHPGQMLGYFRNPEATAAAMTDDGFFRTGDVAVRRPDGNLELVGRMKEMFKSGGYNVYPREIELALEEHSAVRMAAVVAVPDPVFDEVGFAFVECEDGDDVTAEDLVLWCRTRLANYKVPKAVETVSALPLLPIGKVDKKALTAVARRLHGDRTSSNVM